MQNQKLGVRYKSSGGDCAWSPSASIELTVGEWIVFSPCNDGIGCGPTRDAAIADAAHAAGMSVEEFTAGDEFDPVACDIGNDSILVGQVEEIADAE